MPCALKCECCLGIAVVRKCERQNKKRQKDFFHVAKYVIDLDLNHIDILRILANCFPSICFQFVVIEQFSLSVSHLKCPENLDVFPYLEVGDVLFLITGYSL